MRKTKRNISLYIAVILIGICAGLYTGINGLGGVPTIILVAIGLVILYTGYIIGRFEQ